MNKRIALFCYAAPFRILIEWERRGLLVDPTKVTPLPPPSRNSYCRQIACLMPRLDICGQGWNSLCEFNASNYCEKITIINY